VETRHRFSDRPAGNILYAGQYGQNPRQKSCASAGVGFSSDGVAAEWPTPIAWARPAAGRRWGLGGIVLLGLLILWAGVLRAQQSPLSSPLNSKEQIKISADALDADNRNRTFVFTGNVKVVQGSTVITSDRLKVWYRADGESQNSAAGGGSQIKDIEASGNVVILFDGRTAKSEKAVYSADDETLTLIGESASIVDGKNTIRGSRITLYRAKDRITVEGSKKGRVEAVFFPSSNDTD
jgi:lipopolysaccharide export system protein LptA